ncbi:MAG: hypothetical protein WDN08_14645 [Rhizomicrobium sp.]
MSGNPVFGSLVFAAVLIVAVLIALSARSILRVVISGWIGRYLLRPIYYVTLRPIIWLLRRIFRVARRAASPAQADAQGRLANVPYSAMAQIIGIKSLAETALGEVPTAVKHMITRHGLIFKSANANQAVDTLQGTLSFDDAKRNLESAKHYYEEPMGGNVSPGFLYEDSEEALVIRILRDVDLTFFYVTRRINRNVSRNVLKLIAIMTGLVLIFPFAISAVNLVPETAEAFDLLLYVVVCVAFGGSLGLFRLFYSNATRNNGQHFNYFVQTYFGRLLNQHKSAAASFASVLNDRTSDLETVEVNANVWFLNLHWLSARQWFLELYVRNMIFQIARNLWLSYLTVPLFLGIAVGIYFGLLSLAPLIPGIHLTLWAPHWTAWTVSVPWLLLLLIYGWALTGLLNEFWHEITSHGWLGFQTMDVNGVIERNIGPIVREIVDKRRNPYGQRSGP